MQFEQALQAMRVGSKVARTGWNGKGMWVALASGCPQLASSQFTNRHAREFAESNGGKAEVLPYLIMRTAQGAILFGWLASQSDMLAEDWVILP